MESPDMSSPYAGLAKKIRGGTTASTQEFESRPPELCVGRGFDGSAGRGVVKSDMSLRMGIA